LRLPEREREDAPAVHRAVIVPEGGCGELDDPRFAERIAELPPPRSADVVRFVDEQVLAVALAMN
jgi:hypothetical protein